MSQDGSSPKSYIKHPTEKARLDNLAFTSFPEDYLPYTSPSYQRKAPYLVWDHPHYDGGGSGGIFRAKRRKLRRCCCGTAALASAVALLVAAILAIVAVSVYLGVVTNLFRSPILSMSGKFRVTEGDAFEESLLNHTSYEFLAKAEYYKSLVDSAYSSSSLAQAFVASRVHAFRPGSLLVFFRLHLDRRKLDEEDSEAILMAKNVLLEQAIAAPSSSFDNLILDLPSIDIREYEEEEWLLTPDFFLDPEETIRLKDENDNSLAIFTSTSAQTSTTTTRTSQKLPIPETSSTVPTSIRTNDPTFKNRNRLEPGSIQQSRYPHYSTRPSEVKRTTQTSAPSLGKGHGVVGYGYAEWKPIELPEAIQVASVDAVSPIPNKERNPQRSGSIGESRVNFNTATRGTVRAGNSRNPQQPQIASSITSSVSLIIRPSSKNKSIEMSSGIVKPVILDESESFTSDNERKGRDNEASDSHYRKDSASFRYLDLTHDSAESLVKETSNRTLQELSKAKDLFEDLSDISEDSGLEANKSTHHSHVGNVSVETIKERFEKSNISEISSMNSTSPEIVPKSDHEDAENMREKSLVTTTSVNDILTTLLLEDDSSIFNSEIEESGEDMFLDSTLTTEEFLESSQQPTELSDRSDFDSSTTEASKKESLVTSFDILLSTLRTIQDYSSSSDLEDLSTLSFENNSYSGDMNTGTSPIPVLSDTLTNFNDSLEVEPLTLVNEHQYPTPETKIQILENREENTPSSVEINNETVREVTEAASTAPTKISPNTSTTLHQDLQRFRKIVQPFKGSDFNPNDINSKDNFKNDNVFLKVTMSTMRIPLPSFEHSLDEQLKIQENSISGLTTPLPTTTKTENISSEVLHALKCLDSEVTCDSGECIPFDYRCNMRRDCKDNSDEIHCSCSDYLSVIGQSQKICDTIRDCWDLSDEQNCPWCSPGQFLCPQSKSCINTSKVCDGSNDCPLGADERYCVKLAENEEKAESEEYYSEGYLMVRKEGHWGKLCVDSPNDVAATDALKWKLEELGKAVCNTLTYRELQEAIQVQDEADTQKYYQIKGQSPEQTHQRYSAIFQPSSCPSKDVVQVKCKSLECGLRPMAVSSRRRIVGGQSTGSGSWPWQVALYKEGEFQCGAVLVSDTWLISAGHCFYNSLTSHWTGRLGILRRGTELRSPSEQVRNIVRIILHPEYVDRGFINDIALLRMDKPVLFSDYLRPVCLPMATEDVKLWDGQLCSVVGWGKLFEIGHTFPDSLQEVRLPVISTEECRKRIIFLSMYHITDNMFCAGFEQGGRDACLGDSGGPLMCQRQDGRWVLLGVTSNGDGCGRPGRPGVYTKVTQYLQWIEKLMSEDALPTNTEDTCSGHRCELGRCVQYYKVCDGRFDCSDGSDELNCPP